MNASLSLIPGWLDAIAIAIGAGSAAVVAEELRSKRVDWLGVVIIGTSCALGGGVIRDLLIGVRPVAMTNEWYLLTALIASLVGMLLQSTLSHRTSLITLLDALALGFFCAVGTAKGYAAGLPILPAIFIGTCTAVGGGVIRDLLVDMPVGVLYAGSLYAVAAMAGASVYLVCMAIGTNDATALIACGVTAFAIRMASIKFGLSLPEQMALRLPRRRRRRESGKEAPPTEPV